MGRPRLTLLGRYALVVDEPALDRDDNGLGAVAGLEFLEQVLHMHLNGVHGDIEALAYLLVALAEGNQTQDFDLTFARLL